MQSIMYVGAVNSEAPTVRKYDGKTSTGERPYWIEMGRPGEATVMLTAEHAVAITLGLVELLTDDSAVTVEQATRIQYLAQRMLTHDEVPDPDTEAGRCTIGTLASGHRCYRYEGHEGAHTYNQAPTRWGVEREFSYGWDDAGWTTGDERVTFATREEAEREVTAYVESWNASALPEDRYEDSEFRVAPITEGDTDEHDD